MPSLTRTLTASAQERANYAQASHRGGCLSDSTLEMLGTAFGLSTISVILRLVRRPYGLHVIPAIIQIHASHKARGPIACEP